MNEEITKQTEFNSSIAGLMRLNDLLESCNTISFQAITNKDRYALSSWHQTLHIIHKELYPKLSNNEKKEIMKMINSIRKLSPVAIIKKLPDGKKKVMIDHKSFNKHHIKLYSLEVKLRDLADKKGMLITNKISIYENDD